MKYIVTIGLEVHCELKSVSKVFSSAPNDYSEEPNSKISVIDLAFPGILPVVNKDVVKSALTVATALHCKTPTHMLFDRKNYYYPDLPKGFQITQMEDPIGTDGYLDVYVGDEVKRVLIHDTHLEEDTASLDHYDGYSLIDYNRSGVPLLETVTEPCMHSADEALAFLDSLRRLFLYTKVSEARTELGQMRCDVNVSLALPDATELGVKVEMKNINSFNNVRESIEYEIIRQSEMLDRGETVLMETRRYDDTTGKTYRMRSKVDAVDYKYFLEPNIPPVKIDDSLKQTVIDTLPVLPFERIGIYMDQYGLSLYDAKVIVKDKEVAEYFEHVIKAKKDPKLVANWLTTRILGYTSKTDCSIKDITFTEERLIELLDFIESKKISTKQAKDVFFKCIEEDKSPKQVVKESGMEQITDEGQIREMIKEVLMENKETALEYDPEKGRMLDFFVGQTMKKSRGKANPSVAVSILKEELEKFKEEQA